MGPETIVYLASGGAITFFVGLHVNWRIRQSRKFAALEAARHAQLNAVNAREKPLIEQLLEELHAQNGDHYEDCPICRRRMTRIKRLCGVELKTRVDICETCLKGKRVDATQLTVCHRALQDVIDTTRLSYEEDLQKAQERLVLAQTSLADTEAHRLFPDHRAQLERAQREILDSVRRIQGWIDDLACDVVERTAERLADEWRAKHRADPIDRGPYRSLPGALAEEPVLASNS